MLFSSFHVQRDETAAGLIVLRPVGELESATVAIFRETVVGIGAGQRVIIDMSGVPFVDSCGIGALIGAVRRVRELGGTIGVAALCRPVRRVLALAGVDRIVDLTETVAEAAALLSRSDTRSPTDGDPIAI